MFCACAKPNPENRESPRQLKRMTLLGFISIRSVGGVDWDVCGCRSESGLLDEGIILVDINVFLKVSLNSYLAMLI